MITGNFPIQYLSAIQTPYYYYDMSVLRDTLTALVREASEPNWHVHYAVKACATLPIMRTIAEYQLGADCVSGGEIKAAIQAGFPTDKIVFAGVAKTDNEIRYALEQNIFCFNVESTEELDVISQIAQAMNRTARVCLRVNPNVDAHTHEKITTGREENKFGISIAALPHAVQRALQLPNIEFLGLHFHIGSQITDMEPFAQLAQRINQLIDKLPPFKHINVGGGLGILYEHPNHFPIPNFKDYFDTWRKNLKLRDDQQLHFELGRSVVAQCGNLITKVLYVKQGNNKLFAIVDAGMNDLLRPALYGAFHRIENLTHPNAQELRYDIVGPICESSDVFVRNYAIAQVQRGDILAMRSAGAYGETMASQYNLRRLPGHITSDEVPMLSA